MVKKHNAYLVFKIMEGKIIINQNGFNSH